MSQPTASQQAMTLRTPEVANCYLLEICTQVLQGPRFKSDLSSSCLFRTAATKVTKRDSLTRRFSFKLQQKLEALFGSSINLSKVWPAYNKFSISEQLEKDWNEFCSSIELESNPLFWQYVTEEIFKKMLHAKLQSMQQTTSQDSTDAAELTFEERNAINYIGGYVIKQLHSKLVTKKSYVDALLLLQSDSPTGLESAQWTEAIDRGGLIHINEMFYQTLIAIEQVCKGLLVGDVSQLTDIKTLFMDKALSDVDVRFYWDLAMGLTPVEISDDLLKMIVDLFTTVHSHAFTKGYMEKYKQSNKKGTQKSKALRKRLF